MMTTLAVDLTSTLAPFGWAAMGGVGVGFVAILVAALRARRVRRPERAVPCALHVTHRLAA